MGFSWVELHGALTHFPIALLLTAAAFDVGAVLFRKPVWRVVSFWLLVAVAATTIPVLVTGWITGNTLFAGTAAPSPLFQRHRLAAFVTSGLAVLLLLWRVRQRDRLTGAALTASLALVVLVSCVAGFTGYSGGQMVFGGDPPVTTPGRNSAPAAHMRVPAVPAAMILSGQKLFADNHCRSCHVMNGQGARMGPDLTHEARRHADMEWQAAHLKNPSRLHPGSTMPAYAGLTPGQLHALAAYLATRR